MPELVLVVPCPAWEVADSTRLHWDRPLVQPLEATWAELEVPFVEWASAMQAFAEPGVEVEVQAAKAELLLLEVDEASPSSVWQACQDSEFVLEVSWGSLVLVLDSTMVALLCPVVAIHLFFVEMLPSDCRMNHNIRSPFDFDVHSDTTMELCPTAVRKCWPSSWSGRGLSNDACSGWPESDGSCWERAVFGHCDAATKVFWLWTSPSLPVGAERA